MLAISFTAGRLFRDRVFGTRATELWFDRDYVLKHVDEARQKKLSRFGYFVMRDARQLIKHRKRSSKPGESPTNWSDLLKRFIYFNYEKQTRSVVIGPYRLPASREDPPIPAALELGGIVRNRRAKRPVRIRPRPYMQPAFDRQLRKMGDDWRDSIK